MPPLTTADPSALQAFVQPRPAVRPFQPDSHPSLAGARPDCRLSDGVCGGLTHGRLHAGSDMKIAVIGHGMVGHKFLEQLHELGVADAEVTVFCEEPRAAYDRVHLSEFFAGKTAEDLSLVEPGFFERSGFTLRLAAKAVAIERRNNTLTTIFL